MLEIDQVDHAPKAEPADEKICRKKRKMIAFAIPLAIQGALTIAHYVMAYHANAFPDFLFALLGVATVAYTIVIFVVGVLCATSMTLESICAQIKKNEDHSRQWIRDLFKAVKKFIPPYNGSFSTPVRLLAGAASVGLYVFALTIDGFVGNAITVLFSAAMIWFGIWMVKRCYEMVEEERKKKAEREAKKRLAEAEAANVAKAYGQRPAASVKRKPVDRAPIELDAAEGEV
jgi:hypothetical protein